MGRLFALAVLVTAVLGARPAMAKCTKDTECKGDRVCFKGKCVDPPGSPAPGVSPALPPPPGPAVQTETPPPPPPAVEAQPPPPAPPMVESQPPPPPPATGLDVPPPPPLPSANPPSVAEWAQTRRALPPPESPAGWARAGAIVGFISAAAVFSLSVAVVVTDDVFAAVGFGVLDTVLFSVMTPIVASAGSSARWNDDLNGLVGLRIGGWILFAGSLAATVVALGAVLSDVKLPSYTPVMIGTGAALSLIMFAVDDLVSASWGESAAAAYRRPTASSVRFVPLATLTRTATGVAPMAGFAVAF